MKSYSSKSASMKSAEIINQLLKNKNPCELYNELVGKFHLESSLQICHNGSIFTCTVGIESMQLKEVGFGHSKAEAKSMAVKACISKIIEYPPYREAILKDFEKNTKKRVQCDHKDENAEQLLRFSYLFEKDMVFGLLRHKPLFHQIVSAQKYLDVILDKWDCFNKLSFKEPMLVGSFAIDCMSLNRGPDLICLCDSKLSNNSNLVEEIKDAMKKMSIYEGLNLVIAENSEHCAIIKMGWSNKHSIYIYAFSSYDKFNKRRKEWIEKFDASLMNDKGYLACLQIIRIWKSKSDSMKSVSIRSLDKVMFANYDKTKALGENFLLFLKEFGTSQETAFYQKKTKDLEEQIISYIGETASIIKSQNYTL